MSSGKNWSHSRAQVLPLSGSSELGESRAGAPPAPQPAGKLLHLIQSPESLPTPGREEPQLQSPALGGIPQAKPAQNPPEAAGLLRTGILCLLAIV